MLRLRLVNESRIIQISGKMLIASRSAMVGVTNSHAMPRSDRPRPRLATRGVVCPPRRSTEAWGWMIAVIAVFTRFADETGLPGPQYRGDRLQRAALASRCYSEATVLPCSLKTLVQSLTTESSACCAG